MGEVVPARTSPTLLPPSPRTVLSLSCFKCRSASIVVTSTLRVNVGIYVNTNWHTSYGQVIARQRGRDTKPHQTQPQCLLYFVWLPWLPVSMLSLTIQLPVTRTASHCMIQPWRGTSMISPGTRSSEGTSMYSEFNQSINQQQCETNDIFRYGSFWFMSYPYKITIKTKIRSLYFDFVKPSDFPNQK